MGNGQWAVSNESWWFFSALACFPLMNFDQSPPADLARYHRQMLLPGIGAGGQQRLASGHALVVGVGALGCASAELLTRAGVGQLTVIDRDVVELTNLQRQSLFDERDAAEGLPKAVAASQRLHRINSQVRVTPIVEDFTPRAARRRFAAPSFDVIIDGTDNFETRYLLNDLAIKHGIPYCYGGVIGTHGMAFTVRPGLTPCLRCLFDQPPPAGTTPTCDTAGVLGPAVQIVAAWQATDALKLLLGHGSLVKPELREFDLWAGTQRAITLAASTPQHAPQHAPQSNVCVCCGQRRFEYADAPGSDDGATLCGQNAVQIPARFVAEHDSTLDDAHASRGANTIDLPALAERLRPHGPVTVSPFFLRATLTRERSTTQTSIELTVFPDGRSIVRGVSTAAAARTLYARYVGS